MTGKRSPARGYSWPPFQPGNTVGRQFEPGNDVGRQFDEDNRAAEKHGLDSRYVVEHFIEPRAAEKRTALVELAEAPGSPIAYLTDVTYRSAISALCRAEADIEWARQWIEVRGGWIDEDDNVRPVALRLDRLETRAETLRARLGLDPLSRARLGRDVATASVDVARLMAALAQAQEDAEEGNGTVTTVDGFEAAPGPESAPSEDDSEADR